jgi:oxygen-independent coproporphyrinogen-3 oxidase
MASLYIHIPFCEKKCLYCDFYSVEEKELIGRFCASLRKEAEMRGPAWAARTLESVYLGGGTPSLLGLDLLASISALIRDLFTLASNAEATLEVNPGTVTSAKLRGLRELGINRLSIGVQSFNDGELRFLGRIHTAREAVHCVEMARAAGFQNVSVDLIYAIPGQSVASWGETLERAISLHPEHISAYSLIVEENTPLDRMVRAGEVRPAGEQLEADLYEHTMRTLNEAGFEHYEVSNYARPGFRSRHNSGYWSHADYIGLGPSAHSFVMEEGGQGARRSRNLSSVVAYCDMVGEGNLPVDSEEHLSARDLVNERIFLGLRADGLDLRRLKSDYGLDLRACRQSELGGLLEEGLGVMTEGTLRLTAKGYLLCDEIARRLLLS